MTMEFIEVSLVAFSAFLFAFWCPKSLQIGNVAVCQKLALTLMLYTVMFLINRSPALIPVDLKGLSVIASG